MAITTSFQNDILPAFIPRYWNSVDEFEEYYLRRIQETQADTNYYTDRNGKEVVLNFINHHPELKEYEVWGEGYVATGESGSAHLIGKAFARNFAQACDIVMCKNRIEWIEKVNKPSYSEYCPPQKWHYDPNLLRSWHCALFWSKELAEKTFG